MADEKKKGFADEFAAEVVEDLKKGVAPWMKPWRAGELTRAHNPISGTVYRGINQVMLSRRDYADPRWMTMNQANEEGYRVKKGSKAQKIVFWQFTEQKEALDENGQPKLDNEGKAIKETVELDRPRVKFFTVFNATQLQNEKGEPYPTWEPQPLAWNPDERAETIMGNSGVPVLHDQRDRAFYTPLKDEIHLTPRENFPTAGDYYSTALHELGHATGHESRLNREVGKHPFGSEGYAREELRAEIGSWMLAQDLGLPHDPGNHLSYVDNWIQALEKDPREIVNTCRDAEKIRDYVMELEKGKEAEVHPRPDATLEKGFQQAVPEQAAQSESEPVFVVEIPEKTPPRVWKADNHEAFYRFVDRRLEEEGLGATAYKKSTLAQEYDSLALPGETLQQFMANYGLPSSLQPDSPLYIAEYIPTTQDTALFHLEDPGKFASYKAACLHNIGKGHVAEGLHEGAELLQQFKEVPQIHTDLARVMGLSEQVQNVATEKTFLTVPFKEKDEAKQAGAKWDRAEKKWYAPEGSDLAPLEKWLERKESKNIPGLSPQQEFAGALRNAGLVIEGDPVMDGKIQRVAVEGGKKGAKDGAYCAHLDGLPAGWIQNHKTAIQEKWVATGHALSVEQKQSLRKDVELQKEARQEEKQAEQQKAMKRAYAKWMNAEPASPDHPYLQKKGVEASNLRQDKQGNLLVPGRDKDGRLQTLQFISPTGAKWYEKGCPKSGAICMIEGEKDKNKKDKSTEEKDRDTKGEILIAEGYATGASLNQATGIPVAVAFDASNLKEAVQAIRAKMPNVAITICADDDHSNAAGNIGVNKAKEAANLVGGKVMVPTFSKEEKAKGLTDFNDLHKSKGLGAVKKSVDAQRKKQQAEVER